MRIAQEALTFDDVLLIPAYSSVLPCDVSLQTQLTQKIHLNIPLLSAAMDTVTESKLAITLAQEGGIGIIHKNMTIEKQQHEVLSVKKYESGVIRQPITVSPDVKISHVKKLMKEHNISGVPVIKDDQLVGIVTRRDLRFETQWELPVNAIMTPKDQLVTVDEDADRDEVIKLFHQHKIEKVLVTNKQFQLTGLITVKDIQKSKDFPYACKDDDGRLIVGAAVGTGADTQDRITALAEAGADVVVVDTAHGHSRGVIQKIEWIKENFPELQVIGGNIATADAALALAKAGADAVKIGIGPGSICTTRIIAGVGVPQISAVSNAAKALAEYNIPVIADGGIRYSGDVAKAIVAGAHTVMIGSLFAGTEEAPGEVELYQGRSYKSYRGMGSLGAMASKQGSSDRYFQENVDKNKLVPEGIEGRVPYKGSMIAILNQLIGGIRSSMGYTGCANIQSMRSKPEFVRITNAGYRESHVHDVSITKEAPNYRST
ncbi:MAG: IMP dehydrogenase [Methylococcales bacterium]|jgi:IMP dehydrogenase|nr:IMP dehydrogenase [Methylococcales bacterium]